MQKGYLPGELIREIRKRKGLRQSHMLGLDLEASDSQVTLSRIENLRQNPTKDTLESLLDKIQLPYGQFFCPYMENQPAEAFVLRSQIAYLLDRAEGDPHMQALAVERIEALGSRLDMDSAINRQLWLSLRARLATLSGADSRDTLTQIEDGMRLTYPEFDADTFEGDVLIFYECPLMLSLARSHANGGQYSRALAVLERVRAGYEKQPLSDLHKEVLLGEIHCLIVRYLLEAGNYTAALAASEGALAAAKKQTGSSRLPDAIHLRALAVFHATGNRQQAAALLAQAYFAFVLLKKKAMARRVLDDAREVVGVRFDTYGAENMLFDLPEDFSQIKAGEALAVGNLGGLLRQFRLAAGASQADVCRGICSPSFYSRIEAGERSQVSLFILEALMQRLGRDLDLYVDTFSSVAEWEESRLRMRYSREIFVGNREEAGRTLDSLMQLGDFSNGPGKQFLLQAEAMMKYAEGDSQGYLDLLHRAIGVTIPDFCEETIGDQRLTFNECNIINALACHYTQTQQVERGVNLYNGIRDSMNRFYADDSIKARYYLTLLTNLAYCHVSLMQYDRALALADEGECIARRYGVLHMLNDLACVKAPCLHALGRREEAGAYAAMAYFSGNLTFTQADLDYLAALFAQEMNLTLTGDVGFIFEAEKAGLYQTPPGR